MARGPEAAARVRVPLVDDLDGAFVLREREHELEVTGNRSLGSG